MRLTAETGRLGAAEVGIARTLWQKALATTTTLIGVSSLLLMLLAAGHGIDMTDTGFYLNALAHPSEYRAMASQFAHLWSPLFRLVGGDIAAARRVGICAVFALSTVLCWLLIRLSWARARDTSAKPSLGWQIALSLGSSTTGFLVFVQMVMDLNYNVLNLIGIQLTFIGAVLGVLGPRSQRSAWDAGWVLSGASLALLALNKPTTSVLTAVIVATVVALLGRLSWRATALVGLSGALSLGAMVFVIFGGAEGYWEALVNARAHGAALTGHDLANLWRVDFSAPILLELVPAAGVLAAILVPPSVRALLGWALVAAGMVLVVQSRSYLVDSGIPIQVRPWTLVMIPLVLIAWRLLGLLTPNRRDGRTMADILIGLTLSLLPFAWAWGTNNSLIDHAGLSAYFWAIASVWLVPDTRPDLRLAVVAITQLVAMVVLLSWMWAPYRQQEPLFRQDVAALIGPTNSEIRLSETSSEYFRALAERTASDVPSVDTPLIDLTGDSPMTGFGLGARVLGMPWLLGGYPGSDPAAGFALSLADCADLSTAWVLTTDGGPRALSSTVLETLGLKFPDRYAKVWTIAEVPWSGTGDPMTGVKITLWKPLGTLDPTSCWAG